MTSSPSYLRQRMASPTDRRTTIGHTILGERKGIDFSHGDRKTPDPYSRDSKTPDFRERMASEFGLGEMKIPDFKEKRTMQVELGGSKTSDFRDKRVMDLRLSERKTPDLKEKRATEFGERKTSDFKERRATEYSFGGRKTPDFKELMDSEQYTRVRTPPDFKNSRTTDTSAKKTSEFKLGATGKKGGENDFKERNSPDIYQQRRATDFNIREERFSINEKYKVNERNISEFRFDKRNSQYRAVSPASLYESEEKMLKEKSNLKIGHTGDPKSTVYEELLDAQRKLARKDAKLASDRLSEMSQKTSTRDQKLAAKTSYKSSKSGKKISAGDSPESPVPKARTTSERKRKQPVTANLAGSRYEIVRLCVEKAGFTLTRDDDMNSFLTWVDSYTSTDRVAELKSYQRINHFPNMGEICRKDALCRNMMKMAKELPDEYDFTPRTWTFPSEYNTFQSYARELKKKKKVKTFIVKPANGAMGNGIQLYQNPDKIPSTDNTIVQEYIDKPFLIDGYKCDLRIYVLVTSCDPLRVFLFNEGLVRLSTEKYLIPSDSNIDQVYMHLTNYSINKYNEHYDKGETEALGSKRSFKFLNDYLRRHDNDVSFLWRNIVDVIVKALVVAQPHLLHAYRMCRPGQPVASDSVCFEILGFDILLDRKLKPWLLEVNRSPSFGTDEKIDYQVKSALLNDALRLLNIRASDRRKNYMAQKADAQRRLFRTIKRPEKNGSETAKRLQQMERRKGELRDLLQRLRRDASREEYENRNCGRFQRIFPPDDKFRQEKYTALMTTAFSLFLTNRSGTLQRELELTYNNKLKEVDVLDMLAQYETDEPPSRISGVSGRKGATIIQRKPLSSLPTSRDDDDEVRMSTDDESAMSSSRLSHRRSRPLSRAQSFRSITRTPQQTSSENVPPAKVNPGHRSKSLPRASISAEFLLASSSLPITEQEAEMVKQTLIALNEMRIRFPGKSNEEADITLDKIHENWNVHKPKLASYWLVKLDSVKRRKVIDIVRSNVRAAVQRTWKTSEIDSLKIMRTFSRVFNRLLWSHGQGLWNCFTTSGTSWETIFSKSTDVVSTIELNCCRRIVQLCKDCLLVVYQFAMDAKTGQQANNDEQERTPVRPSMTGRLARPSYGFTEKME